MKEYKDKVSHAHAHAHAKDMAQTIGGGTARQVLSSGKRLRTAVFAAVGLLGAIAALPTQAASVPFTWALNFSYNPDATGQAPSGHTGNAYFDWIQTINSSPVTPATSTYSQSGTWGSVSGYASANLATGQLKMQASVSNGDGSAAPYMQTNASFGDSFTTTTANGSPFVWNGQSATFNIALNGNLDSNNNFTNSGAFVILAILKKGTLDPAKPLIGSPDAIEYFLWDLGNPNLQIYYTDPQGVSQALAITGGYSTLPSSLSASFAPGGDFDWAVLLGASSQLGSAGDYFSADLAHTLTLNYVAPQGAVTASDSGQFGNISNGTVPESGTLSLLGLAMLGLMAIRRRQFV